jgi:hypothetical protein
MEASGLMPLEYMLTVLRDENAEPKERFAAAQAAAPYCHAKLASVEYKGDADAPLTVEVIEFKVDAVTKRADTSALPSPSMGSVAGED